MQERREGYVNLAVDIATIKQTLIDMSSDVRDLKEAKIKQNGRIGKLENWRFFVLGACAIVIFIMEHSKSKSADLKIGLTNSIKKNV